MKDSTCIITCALNEELYIFEWVYYHLKIGFNHIFICDTSNNFSLNDTNLKYDSRITLVSKPRLNGPFLQNENLTFLINNYCKDKYKYTLSIDVDEFVCLKKHETIQQFLQDFNLKTGSLGINWVFFGTSDQEKYSPEPVLCRFNRCGLIDKHIKTLVVTNDIKSYDNPHFFSLKRGYQVNENKKIYNQGYFQEDSTNYIIQINHYLTKSKEEYMIRNKNHHTRPESNNSHFIIHNQNEYIDNTAKNLFLKSFSNNFNFDYDFYITNYPDLLLSGIFNKDLAFNHFTTKGKIENRINKLNFDYDYYKKNNNDLNKLNNEELWAHFITHGKNEERKFRLN